MSKLRLGPLPKTEVVRLTIALTSRVKADLDRYVEAYAAAYGEPVEAAVLVPHMLAAFMDRDRGFKKSRQVKKLASDGSSPLRSIPDATPSANDRPSDASSSR